MFCKCSFILIAPLASLAALARSLRSPCQCEAIFVRLAMILGRLGASGASGMPQKTAQVLPRGLQSTAKTAQEAPKTSPRGLKTSPDIPRNVICPFSLFLCSEDFGQHPNKSSPQLLSKTSSRRPKELPDTPKSAQDVPKTSPDASKTPPNQPLSDSEDLLVIPWLLLPRCCSFCVSCVLQVQFHPDRSACFARCARSLAPLAPRVDQILNLER